MKKRILYLLFSALILILWQYFGSQSQNVRLLISSPSLIANYFFENIKDLSLAVVTTMTEAIIGLVIATLFSFCMMILCFWKPKILEFILPVMVTSQVIPLIVLAPFFIILLGIGITSKIAMAAVISFFPIFINFAQGYKTINNSIHELMFIYDAPLVFRIKKVYFPLSLSNIIAGLKISSTLAIIGAIVAEYSGAQQGLGKNLFISSIRLDSDLMMTSLLLSAIIGLAFYGIITFAEKRFLKWAQ